MKLNKLIIAFALPILAMSCKKFLDVTPKGVIIAQHINDYEAILNDDIQVNPFGNNTGIYFPTDDLNNTGFLPQNQSSAKGNMYFWREYINNGNEKPDMWSDIYNRIANLNLVTEEVLSAPDGTDKNRKQLYAEAMTMKAFLYQHLLSFFAPAYTKSTAAANFGVPYVTSTDQSKKAPARPSLEESYNTIVNDLLAAIPDLPERNINNTRPTKNVAYALLSRIYLSMEDFDNSLKYADLVLASGDAAVLNYNDYVGQSLPATNSSPEELFVRYAYSTLRYSDELLSKYKLSADLRIQLLATKQTNGSYNYAAAQSYSPNRGIGYPEIYLNKAECLARSGDIDGALEIINTDIRENRFDAADYTPLTAATKEQAINAVLQERRRELAFKGVRWIDMKRLDAEGRMPAVNRIGLDGTTVLATLVPGSVNYTFQIPLQVQAFNPGIVLNKR